MRHYVVLVCAQEHSTSSSEQQEPSQPASSTSSSTSTATDGASNPNIAGSDSKQLQVSKEVIETLRNKVFGEPRPTVGSDTAALNSLFTLRQTLPLKYLLVSCPSCPLL
jgi:hypothetical protein